MSLAHVYKYGVIDAMPQWMDEGGALTTLISPVTSRLIRQCDEHTHSYTK